MWLNHMRKGYKNIRLESERVAEFEYQPGKCKQGYRIVALEKNLSVERGERVLFDDIRYFSPFPRGQALYNDAEG